MHAFILINVESESYKEVCKWLGSLAGIQAVHAWDKDGGGPFWQVVVEVINPNNKAGIEWLNEAIRKSRGVLGTAVAIYTPIQ